jgi:hypothetical protein
VKDALHHLLSLVHLALPPDHPEKHKVSFFKPLSLIEQNWWKCFTCCGLLVKFPKPKQAYIVMHTKVV